MQPEYHVDLCVVGIGGERADAELNHTHRRYEHENHVEEEAVHPCLVFLHGVEPTATGNADAKLDSPFLNTP